LQGKRLGLDLDFYNAILGRDLPSDLKVQFRKQAKNEFFRELTDGEIGCYMSHIGCINKFFESGDDYILITEDDILFSESVPKLLEKIKEINQPIFDVLLIGYRNGYFSYFGSKKQNNIHMNRFVDCGYGAHAYVLSRKGAKKILDSHSIPTVPFDYVTGGWKDESLRVYGMENKVVELDETSEDSSLEADRSVYEARRFRYFNNLKKKFIWLKRLKPITCYHD
jgi:glycosyl transferase family 25